MDPYRPIREELGRISGTLERGLVRRSQGETARQALELGHEARMTGLGMEKTRLGLTEEKHGKEMALLDEEERWGKEKMSFSLNLPQLETTYGPEIANQMMSLISDDAEVDESTGVVTIETTKGNYKRNMGLLEKLMAKSGKGETIQDDKGNYYRVFYDGRRKVDMAIQGLVKETPYDQTKEGVIAKIAGREKVAGIKEKSKVPFREKENYKSLIKRRLAIYKILDSGKEKDEIGMTMDLTPTRRIELENKIKDIDAQMSGKPRKTEETTMPPADQNEGRFLRDTKTNILYKSIDGQWIEQ